MVAHFILFVADPARARRFYEAVLGQPPRLEVPGMVEFELSAGAVLGLMPEAGIQRLLSRTPVSAGERSIRAELYLYPDLPEAALARALQAGATELSAFGPRDWGDDAGYVRDPDGHVVAFARRR